jgi:pimeloyl-ACP methyl ester carboxylesterase
LFPLKPLLNLIARTKIITVALQSAYSRSISNDILLKRIVTVPAQRPNAFKALRSMCIGMSNRPNSAKGPSIIEKIQNLPNRPPILLIWGNKDKLIPIFLAKKLIKLHPWIKLVVINDAGHCLHDELPKYFNQIVLKWLENLKTSK